MKAKPKKVSRASTRPVAASGVAAVEALDAKKPRSEGQPVRIQPRTLSGIPVKRSYGPEDVAGLDYERDLGEPGEFPFTRGIYPEMYRKRVWTFRQLSGFGTASASNQRFDYLLRSGATALSVCFDLPTKMGRDSDDEMAEGEVGRGGVAVDSLADMERLFQGIPLDRVSTNLVTNAQSSVLFAFYLAVAEKQGVAYSDLRGTIQNDMLKEFVAEKSYIFAPRGALRLAMDIVAYAIRNVPKWNPISICGYHIRSAGSNAIQEVAFCLANATAYVDALLARGLEIDEFAPRLSFFFKAQNDFFEEIAKYRAARRLWARIVRDKYDAQDPRSLMLRFHTQTAGSSLTVQEPENNIIRSTVQALAAILGGTQSLHINSYDEALCLPSEKAARIAIRTHQILGCESGVGTTADPLGGSYYVESLTSEIERRVQEYLDKIERQGGVIASLEKGYIQREIAASAFEFAQEVENKERIIVGVNEFGGEDDSPPEVFEVDDQEEQLQAARLQQLRKSRNDAAVEKSLERLRETARGEENLMPSILEAAKAYATMGEITSALAEVFGRYEETAYF
jgi:methylmalonyl-CoA mutase N-terminal domain/subunit